MQLPYDVISLGAGVQSTVMLLLADRGELPGYNPQAAIFADTGWEPKAVYRHLDWLRCEVNLPVHVVRGPGDLREFTIRGWRSTGEEGFSDIPHFLRSPGGGRKITQRQCTKYWKALPVRRLARMLAGLPSHPAIPPAGSLRMMMGITCDEAHRMKDSPERYIINAYPLIDMGWTRTDCVRWFAERWPGRQLPKSACLGCPYHSDAYWVDLYRNGGKEWDETVAVDQIIRKPNWPGCPPERRANPADVAGLHPRGPLEKVIPQLAADSAAQQSLFDAEPGFGADCDGYCSV